MWKFSLYIIGFGILMVPAISFSSLSDAVSENINVKIGQMIIVGFRGLSVDSESPIINDITKRNIGGVILFDYDVPSGLPVRNIESPDQVRALISSLKEASSMIPLFVAIDQEGGRVSRLKERFGFSPSVSQHYLGKIDDPDVTRRYAEKAAKTIARLGINVNFAPVVDLDRNPENPVIGRLGRSFSCDPAIVWRHSTVVIETLHNEGVLSAIKHFPGHGSSSTDSHKGFVDVTDQWSPDELQPFAAIIRSGLCDMVMTAHIFNAELDPLRPATLSYRIINDILRDNLGFDGVVVSDDMQMEAIRSYYGLEEAIKMAIDAGCDILIFANNSVYDEDIAQKAIVVIQKLVASGEIPGERIEKSYRRILRLKKKLEK